MSHLRDVVHPRRKETLGIIVAAVEPCFTIASDQQLKGSGRTIHVTTPQGFPLVKRPKSWAVAVILCPGDDTKDLARFVTRSKLAPERFHFYYHPSTNYREALRHWHEAGLSVFSTWPVASWRDLNPHFSAQWNNLAHDDYCTVPNCVMH